MPDIVQEPAVAYNRRLTPVEYLSMEPSDQVRYEYWDGDLLAMAGTTTIHNEIAGNIYSGFRVKRKNKACKVFINDINVSLDFDNVFVLPDVVFTCHEEDLKSTRIIRHPSIIVEVLSDSTELHDRKRKWEQYRKLKSLRYFLMVSQDRFFVEMYHRKQEHALFHFQDFEGLDAVIPFDDFGFSIRKADIYENIVIEPGAEH